MLTPSFRILRPLALAAALLGGAPAFAQQQAVAPQAPAQAPAQDQAPAKPKLERPEHAFLWKIEKEGLATSYLFGTMHVPDQRFIKFNEEVRAAFKNADSVYTELDMDMLNGPEAQQRFLEIGVYQDGRTLADVVPAEAYAKLEKLLQEEFAFPIAGISSFRPFFAAVNLEQIAMSQHYPRGTPLDAQIWNASKKAGKKVGGVETLEEQIAALTVLTEAEAVEALVEQIDRMVEDAEQGRHRILELAEHYLAGDEEAIYAYVQEDYDPQNPIHVKSMKALLDTRNITMAERSAKIMQANPEESSVFVFGTLHMLGPMSVNKLLQEQGFQVTRLTAPPKRTVVPAAPLVPARKP